MRGLRTITISLGALWVAACGGTNQQPEMPDPTVVDQSADDLGLPDVAPEEDSEGPTEAEAADEPPAPPVRVVAGERTPLEGSEPSLRITAPRNNQRIARAPVTLRISLRNWELEPEPGRHVHVIIDDEPYIAVRDVSRPIDLNQLMQEHLGKELTPGTHVLRVFPSRGHHESVKRADAFAVTVFHLGQPTEDFSFDPSAPLLTYSRPKGCNPADERLLLDFFLSNVELSADGPRVRYDLDRGQLTGEITSWDPHWIEGLQPGEHTIRLTLVDAEGQPIPGPFNDTTRTIRVAERCT